MKAVMGILYTKIAQCQTICRKSGFRGTELENKPAEQLPQAGQPSEYAPQFSRPHLFHLGLGFRRFPPSKHFSAGLAIRATNGLLPIAPDRYLLAFRALPAVYSHLERSYHALTIARIRHCVKLFVRLCLTRCQAHANMYSLVMG